MNAAEHRKALHYWTLTNAMYADPDLTGDVQTLALGLARQLVQPGRAQLTPATHDLGWTRYQVIDAIRSDIPRHTPAPATGLCPAPDPTNSDGLCARPAQAALTGLDINPATGHQHRVGFCSRHGALHRDLAQHWNEWRANNEPADSPNAGGILPRYFRTASWPDVYQRARTGQLLRTNHLERPDPISSPRLTLVSGVTS